MSRFRFGRTDLAHLRVKVRKTLRHIRVPNIVLHIDEQEAGALRVEWPDAGERALVLLPHVGLLLRTVRTPLELVEMMGKLERLAFGAEGCGF